MGSILCEHCTGLCCRYIALPIEKPTTRRDFDDIRWYVMHEGITVYKEDGDWFIQIAARCKNLQNDNRCGVYDTRPAICREYKAGNCDYPGGDYEYECLFTTPEDVEDYARRKLKGRHLKIGSKDRTPPAGTGNPARSATTQLKILLTHA